MAGVVSILPVLVIAFGRALVMAGAVAVLVGFDRAQGGPIAWGGSAMLAGLGVLTVGFCLPERR
jgi:hypothetical protein